MLTPVALVCKANECIRPPWPEARTVLTAKLRPCQGDMAKLQLDKRQVTHLPMWSMAVLPLPNRSVT